MQVSKDGSTASSSFAMNGTTWFRTDVFLYDGERYIMTGQLTGGKYLCAAGQGKNNFPAGDKRHIWRHNRGVVYVV